MHCYMQFRVISSNMKKRLLKFLWRSISKVIEQSVFPFHAWNEINVSRNRFVKSSTLYRVICHSCQSSVSSLSHKANTTTASSHVSHQAKASAHGHVENGKHDYQLNVCQFHIVLWIFRVSWKTQIQYSWKNAISTSLSSKVQNAMHAIHRFAVDCVFSPFKCYVMYHGFSNHGAFLPRNSTKDFSYALIRMILRLTSYIRKF